MENLDFNEYKPKLIEGVKVYQSKEIVVSDLIKVIDKIKNGDIKVNVRLSSKISECDDSSFCQLLYYALKAFNCTAKNETLVANILNKEDVIGFILHLAEYIERSGLLDINFYVDSRQENKHFGVYKNPQSLLFESIDHYITFSIEESEVSLKTKKLLKEFSYV